MYFQPLFLFAVTVFVFLSSYLFFPSLTLSTAKKNAGIKPLKRVAAMR